MIASVNCNYKNTKHEEVKKLNHKGTRREVAKPAVIYLKSARHGLSLIFLLPLLSLFYPNDWATAKIFKYVDSNGIIHLSNVPGNRKYQEWIKVPGTSNNRMRKSPVESKDKITKVVEVASSKYGINSDLIRAVIRTESNFNPGAISPKGAMGLMQLMPDTARQYKVDNPFDPGENIHGGVQHLNYLLSEYNYDLKRALAAYNAGKGSVDQFNGVPPFPETVDYINRVLYYYQNPGFLRGNQATLRHKIKRAIKIFRYVSPDGVILFTNVRQ